MKKSQMAKVVPVKAPVDLSTFGPSVFTLTFVVEVVGVEVWQDCNEGWIELGPIVQGVKLSYQLYPGQTFNLDIVIWPHTAKVLYGENYDWVRTWQYLERRWLAFSIRHAFPVRVMDLHDFVATVTPYGGIGVLSANSKMEKATQLYLPPLRFGERRQFAQVIESEYPLTRYIEDMIWFRVVIYIPTSYMDGLFDTPYPVQDIRHQDAALYNMQQIILNALQKPVVEVIEEVPAKGRRLSKDKKKTLEVQKIKYELTLSGDWILAGIGRVTPFVINGDRPADQGEVIALISSTNLPAYDDCPVFFVNVGNLSGIPVEHLKQNRFTHIYTRWTISEEEHDSAHLPLPTNDEINGVDFNDHHSVPLSNIVASDVMAIFLDEPFQIELRGIRIPPPATAMSKFFGYDKRDRNFIRGVPPPLPNQDADILLAQTKIDTRALTKINGHVKGEFPLFPPETNVVPLGREGICTNGINGIRRAVKPDLIIQPGVILEAQMMLDVSLGLVGCKPQPVTHRYSRLYCLISDHDAIMALLREITEINENIVLSGNIDGLLTGFGLDTGDTVMLYVEGPKDGHILQVWERTEDFYPTVKPNFSTSAKYIDRLYPELLLAAMPFNILKMFVPLAVLLGLTPIYARPALPLPTRAALLKLGRLITSKFANPPNRHDMPTAMELKSFRLELCVAPRPPPMTVPDIPSKKLSRSPSKVSSHKTVTTKSVEIDD